MILFVEIVNVSINETYKHGERVPPEFGKWVRFSNVFRPHGRRDPNPCVEYEKPNRYVGAAGNCPTRSPFGRSPIGRGDRFFGMEVARTTRSVKLNSIDL